jgi:SAM-dependent methyltransferase
MSLRAAWDAEAGNWIRWARAPGHDAYWRFHRDHFLSLLPAARRLTLDLGAGEGRLARDLSRLGHHVLGFDASWTMAEACATHDAPVPVAVGDVAWLPVRDGAADLAVAFMSFQDVDDLDGAVAEAARVLEPRGVLVLAIVHPINSGGAFEQSADGGPRPFVIRDSYFAERHTDDLVDRDGLPMRFVSAHRTLETYSRALESHGFVIEALREVTEPDPEDTWHRMPLFLHLRAVKR